MMAEMMVVDEANRDDLSRKAGIFLYSDTKLWLEGDKVHRADGPAVQSPDGVERWYLDGQELTREVKDFFAENKWRLSAGLDTPEKLALFQARFLK